MTIDPAPPRGPSGLRPWMIVAPAAVIVVGGLGFMLLRGPASQAVADMAGQMQVEVVAPVEPEVQPGGTMEVGQLTDGYTHVAIAPAARDEDAYDPTYETAWVEPLPPLPTPVTTVWRSRDDAPPATRPAGDTESAFGFDRSGPDYAAERRARQERLDRIQAEQAAQGRPGAPVSAPGLDRETAFY